uniref:Uncharacterized protein n=1 Tax=Nothobranchius furzeri TaxID=105023 RepID=A0A8C6P271_NOTFU
MEYSALFYSSLSKFKAYEDYLDSKVTAVDLFYLQVSNLTWAFSDQPFHLSYILFKGYTGSTEESLKCCPHAFLHRIFKSKNNDFQAGFRISTCLRLISGEPHQS